MSDVIWGPTLPLGNTSVGFGGDADGGMWYDLPFLYLSNRVQIVSQIVY